MSDWIRVKGIVWCNFLCRNYNPVLSSFMTYHQMFNKSTCTSGGVTCGAETANPSEAVVFIPAFMGSCLSVFNCVCSIISTTLCLLLLFLWDITVSVLLGLSVLNFLCSIISTTVCLLLPFLWDITLSVLRFATFNFTFYIFKPLFHSIIFIELFSFIFVAFINIRNLF